MRGNQIPVGGLQGVRSSRDRDLAAYDRLPPSVRTALRGAAVSISAESALDALHDGDAVDALCGRIAMIDERARAAWRAEVAEACAR